MQRSMLCLALALALAGLTTIPAGCKEEDEPFGCTLELNYSLLLSIVDAETGEPILDATVTFLIDGVSLSASSAIFFSGTIWPRR